MDFRTELSAVLPGDLPERDRLIDGAARHLELIAQANQHFNLTRITTPREAAVKHVLDSVLPWRLFENAGDVIDAGTGAGFPGIPLALILPQVHFTLTDSVGKKARFVEAAAADLGLRNVTIIWNRAEEVLRQTRAGIITGRAVAPLDRAAALFGPAIRNGTRGLFYKGPDALSEIAAARPVLSKLGLSAEIAAIFELPDALGTRTIVSCTKTTALNVKQRS